MLGDGPLIICGTGIALETKRERTSSQGQSSWLAALPTRRFLKSYPHADKGEAGSVQYQQKFLSAHQAATRGPTLRVACVFGHLQSFKLIITGYKKVVRNQQFRVFCAQHAQ